MRTALIAALAATSSIAWGSASAHVSLQQPEAKPGTYRAVLGIPHGCDGEPTTSLRVELPEGFLGAKPMPKPGWTIEIEEGNYARSYDLHGEEISSGPLAVTWTGGSLADSHYDEFTLRGTLAGIEEGDRLYFRAVQTCPSGKQEAWTEIAAPGQDTHALENPAPFLTIAAQGAEDGHEHHGTNDVSAGDLEIEAPWARAMLPGQPTGGAYVTLRNAGGEPDRLISVTSPAAGRVEIHTMEMKDEVMVMRPVEGGLELPAGESVELKPGGLHLMFFELQKPFVEGDTVPVRLRFEKTGEVDVAFPVLSARTGRQGNAHQH